MSKSKSKEHCDATFKKNENMLREMGENIRIACRLKGLTQQEVANQTDLSLHVVRRIERGDPSVYLAYYIDVLELVGLHTKLNDLVKIH